MKIKVHQMVKTVSTTLDEAIAWVMGHREDGAECPCCGQLAKVYKRTISDSAALALIYLDWHFQKSDEWIHAPSYLSREVPNTTVTAGREWAKLVHWGLLEEKESDRTDGGKHAGFYRITDLGKRFVRCQVRIPKYVYIYDGMTLVRSPVEGQREELISIRDALKTKFNYDELMKPREP